MGLEVIGIDENMFLMWISLEIIITTLFTIVNSKYSVFSRESNLSEHAQKPVIAGSTRNLHAMDCEPCSLLLQRSSTICVNSDKHSVEFFCMKIPGRARNDRA